MNLKFPDSPYELHQPFPPAGDQPEAIDKLVEGLSDGLAFQTLLGVTGSGKTFTMANVIARTGRPALVLAPNKTLAAQLYSEFREFLPNNAIEYFVSYYDYYQPEAYVPSRDLYIEKDSSINEHIEQMRLSATKSILERSDAIIVATVSCIYGIGDPGDYQEMRQVLREKDPVPQRDLQLVAPIPADRHRLTLLGLGVLQMHVGERLLDRRQVGHLQCALGEMRHSFRAFLALSPREALGYTEKTAPFLRHSSSLRSPSSLVAAPLSPRFAVGAP